MAINLAGLVIDELTDSVTADIARAEYLAGRAVMALPRNARAHFAKGQVRRAQIRYEEAILEYETAIALDGSAVFAIAAIGRCKIMTGPIEEVIPLVEQALRLSPRDPYVALWYEWIGCVHLLQSRTDDAVLCFEKARSATPSQYIHGYLAAAYALKGESERATADLAEARRRCRDDRFASIARLRTVRYYGVPKIRALFEATYFAGLRKAGIPEG